MICESRDYYYCQDCKGHLRCEDEVTEEPAEVEHVHHFYEVEEVTRFSPNGTGRDIMVCECGAVDEPPDPREDEPHDFNEKNWRES